MTSSLFKKKDIAELLRYQSPLKKELTTFDLVFLGIGAIIGTGIFVLTGVGALKAGPSLMLSFVLAALCCLFAAFCYAEFASTVPISGSVYTYTYITLGEFLAFIIGWDLILEYLLATATVSVGWSGYLVSFIEGIGINIPQALTAAAGTYANKTTFINLPAIFIIGVITLVIAMGIRQTKRVNNILVAIKVAIVLLFIVVTIWYVKPENWTPFAPFGFFTHSGGESVGILPAASIVFFSYIGFDAISSSAEETVNPQKSIPQGILISLGICTILYVIMTAIMTGVVYYPHFADYLAAPVSYVLQSVNQNWMAGIVNVGAILGMTTVMIVMFYGQTRVAYAMSRDGLFPKIFSKINPKTDTPFTATLITGGICALAGGFINLNVLSELVNIGTLTAFFLVSIAVIILRKTQPDLKRSFRAPFVPVLPIVAALFCLMLIAGLQWQTWLRFLVWLLIGVAVYFLYARHHSKMK